MRDLACVIVFLIGLGFVPETRGIALEAIEAKVLEGSSRRPRSAFWNRQLYLACADVAGLCESVVQARQPDFLIVGENELFCRANKSRLVSQITK